MHWGTDVALEKHYVPSRSQRTRSVLTFFAEDADSHTLLYANADLFKATEQGGPHVRRSLAHRDRPRPEAAHHGQQSHHPTRARQAQRPRHHLHHLAGPHPQAVRRPPRPPRQGLDRNDDRPRWRQDPPSPSHRRPHRHPEQLPRHTAADRRRRPRSRRTHHPDHQRPDQPRQEDRRAVRPPDEHRTAPRRIDPLLRPGRPRRRRPAQRRPRRRADRAGPHRLRRHAPPTPRLRHHHPRHPATPVPANQRRDPQPRRRDHRPTQPPRLLTRATPSRTPHRHRPLVGQPTTQLPVHLKLGSNSLRENRR